VIQSRTGWLDALLFRKWSASWAYAGSQFPFFFSRSFRAAASLSEFPLWHKWHNTPCRAMLHPVEFVILVFLDDLPGLMAWFMQP